MHPPLLPSFRLGDIDHAVVGFDVAWRDGEQLVDLHPGALQNPQHEVVALTALVRRRKHLVGLFLFEVFGHLFCPLRYSSHLGNHRPIQPYPALPAKPRPRQ